MKVSGIDKEFVEIIEYLNSHGYKPWASCDGVLASHENPNDVNSAYIALLRTKKCFPLIAAFLRDPAFSISIFNCSEDRPYYLYGNKIFGNGFLIIMLSIERLFLSSLAEFGERRKETTLHPGFS